MGTNSASFSGSIGLWNVIRAELVRDEQLLGVEANMGLSNEKRCKLKEASTPEIVARTTEACKHFQRPSAQSPLYPRKARLLKQAQWRLIRIKISLN